MATERDLRERLVAMLRPTAIGDELAPGVRLVSVSSEMGLRLSLRAHDVEVLVEVWGVGEARKFAARSLGGLAFAYRSSTTEPIDPALGISLCRTLAERVSGREAELTSDEREQRADRVREVEIDRLLEPAAWNGARFFTLSPYVGCTIGCRFCYAQGRVASVRRLEGLTQVPWGSYVDARVNAPEVLRRELADLPPGPIKFCPIVSDPYQSIEARFGLTRRCLEVLRSHGGARAVLVLTRSNLIARDVDVMAHMPSLYAGASIPTIDDRARRHFEPRAASIEDRLAALGKLSAAGVKTFAMVQPILPGSIDALAEALARVVTSVRIDVLRGVEGASEEFANAEFSVAAEDAWQRERADELALALTRRGVALWSGELPPDLA